MESMSDQLKREFEGRIAAARVKMEENDLQGLFVFSDEYRPGNARYFTGFQTINMIEESSHALFLPLSGRPVAFTGPLNRFAARRDSHIDDVRPIPALAEHMRAILSEHSYVERIGLVGSTVMPLSTYEDLVEGLGVVELVPTESVMVELRSVKSPLEMDLMREAGRIGDVSLRTALEHLEVGATEREVVAVGEHATRLAGGDIGCAYLVVSGANTDLPTWRPSDRRVEDGELVMLDFGPSYFGYASDVAVTVAVGEASSEVEELVAFAWRMGAQMMDFIQPGVKASSVFDQVDALVEQAGFEDYFRPYTDGTRAIGHGVGLDVVELPDLGPRSDYDIEVGMVLAAKFDLHGLPWGGIRVEHVVAVTEEGPESLNCPLSDGCPARDDCKFYRPGGESIEVRV